MTSISRRQLLAALSAVASGSLPGCRHDRKRLGPVEGSTSGERAIHAARRFSGATLNVGWETGMQAQDPLRYSDPLWERLTGVRINLVELGTPLDLFRRTLEEHRGGAGNLDCGMAAPAWLPDLVEAGALEPLDEYIAHYGVPADLDDILPLYRPLGDFGGHTYGLFDDGDQLLLYYRRDIFEDPANQREFAARFGRPLGDPRHFDWQQFIDACLFFTARDAPRRYGMGPFNRDLRWGWFQALLRRNGGQFFDPKTMKPGVADEPGIRTMARLAQIDRVIPPGTYDVAPKEAMLTTYIAGGSVMASFWPPLGRWAEGYGLEPQGGAESRGGRLPRTEIAGKTGYALLPGGVTEAALGYLMCVFSRSRQKELAYLYIQWLNSPEVSLARVMLPYALRDPFRKSHIESPTYRALWPNAPEYLDLLGAVASSSGTSLLDLIIPGHADYADAFFAAATDVRLGADVRAAMERLSARWDAITDRYGRGRQRRAYLEYLKRPGATLRTHGT
jgi:multiple sugar transport system substrate-binding protein